ncbi:MAG: hypothetical protein R3Y29_04345 [bacterium]
MKLNSNISGAVRRFTYWFANGTLGYPLLEGIEYTKYIKEEPSFSEQAYAIFINNLEIDENGDIVNFKYAEQRAAQYIKRYFEKEYIIEPSLDYWEVELY